MQYWKLSPKNHHAAGPMTIPRHSTMPSQLQGYPAGVPCTSPKLTCCDMQLTQSHLLSFVAAYKSHIASVHQDGGVSPTDIQYDAPWPLDRIDQDALPLNNEYSYSNAGSNVNVYIIDTVGPFNSPGCILQQPPVP